MRCLRPLLLIAAVALMLTPSIQAAVVFYDDFDGDGLSGLNGTTPDISTTGAMWEAGPGFLNDGTASGDTGSQAAHLDLALEEGKMYIAEATLLNDQRDWIGFGFFVRDITFWTTSSSGNARHSSGDAFDRAGGAIWMLTRNHSSANDQEGFKGAGTSTPQSWNGDVVDPTEPIDMKVILDNRGDKTVGSYYLNGTLMSTTTFGSLILKPVGINDGNPGGGIGFSHTSDSDDLGGVLRSFKLTVVPEPSSIALGVMGVAGLLVVVGRRV
ncbi:hypothetical protein [Aeoliella sp.]|uniref:hypothetical protein n=1 Tax=Aeoliella sp. TaxID=2795800 RepID=UPI003CCBDB15